MLSLDSKKRFTLLVMGIGLMLCLALLYGRTPPQKRQPLPPPVPRVEIIVAHPVSHQLLVHTQGNVQPRREIDLVTQVTGNVIFASNHFADGGFFDKAELLVSIEQDDYLIAEQQAKARVADAQQQLAQERGRVRQAKREWRDLGNADANELFLRKPQLASAKAALASAKAGLKKARLDIKRTLISAPFSGRIRKTLVDVGQYVTAGSPLARIYSSDIAEVRLPLTDRQAAMLNLPQYTKQTTNPTQSETGLTVRLENQFENSDSYWLAKIVRTDASIDIESRQLFAVAEIQNPFTPNNKTSHSQALSVGQFVDAYIKGRTVENVLILPRKALRPQNRLWIIGEDNRLHIEQVKVLQNDYNQVVVQNNFIGPQQVITSTMSFSVEGMPVLPRINQKNTTLSDAHQTESKQ